MEKLTEFLKSVIKLRQKDEKSPLFLHSVKGNNNPPANNTPGPKPNKPKKRKSKGKSASSSSSAASSSD
eukprot:6486326-Amphidinium_carterae.1